MIKISCSHWSHQPIKRFNLFNLQTRADAELLWCKLFWRAERSVHEILLLGSYLWRTADTAAIPLANCFVLQKQVLALAVHAWLKQLYLTKATCGGNVSSKSSTQEKLLRLNPDLHWPWYITHCTTMSGSQVACKTS